MHYPWLLSLILFAVFAVAATGVSAQQPSPSFDCSRAITTSERLVCSSDQLAQLDRALNDAYLARRSSLDATQAAALLTQQRQWLREIAPRCHLPLRSDVAAGDRPATVACFAALYRTRIAELGGPKQVSENSAVEFDERDGAYADARLLLARIQSDLERIPVR